MPETTTTSSEDLTKDAAGGKRTEPGSFPFDLREDGTGIRIAGWDISSTEGPIANSASEEKLCEQLNIKLPSMLFDTSKLQLRFGSKDGEAGDDGDGFGLCFDAVNALKQVGQADPEIKVKAAAKWKGQDQRSDVEIASVQNDKVLSSDWTFTTRYRGTFSPSSPSTGDAKLTIDYDALRDTSLPILFSSQVILFEDELDDNGIACYKVRIRVMPTFYFILARFFLRVDSVLVRIYDTRYFYKFGSPAIVCETIHRQASIPQTLQHLHLSVLRDPDLLAPKVPISFRSLENIHLSSLEETKPLE